MSTLAKRLREMRHKKGLTIQEVSTQTGIPVSTYKEWENGRQIRGEPYLLLAQTYQVSLHEILTGEKGQANQLLEKLEEMERRIQDIKKDLISLF